MARKPNPLKRKLRQFKLEYIDSKQTEGGYCAEGKMALLAELKKTPEAWNSFRRRHRCADGRLG